jgi:hypothetical protein
MKTKSLNQKLAYIQAKFHSKKTRYNSFGKYNFRSAEDILEAIKPFLLELDVTVRINEELTEVLNVLVIQSVATITDGEKEIHATAVVGIDLDQKGMQMPQKFGSASYGKKYALGNLLLIDDTQDSDATNDHGKSTNKVSSKNPLNKGTKEFDAAKKYIAEGNSIDTVKLKYEISSDVEKLLLS